MSESAIYPSSYTDSSTGWSIIIAEKLTSTTPGDRTTLEIPSLYPKNKFIFLHLPKFRKSIRTMDAIQHIPGDFHIGTLLGALDKRFRLSDAVILDRSALQLLYLDEQIEDWMANGNGQPGQMSLYVSLQLTVGTTKYYFGSRVNGIRQNWMRAMIKSYEADISVGLYKANFELEAADN